MDNVDSNRDYYGPCGSEASPFILKSTTSLDHFLTQENIVAALTVHSPFQIAAYPWSFASHAYPNETAEFDRLAKLLAQYSGYPTGTAGDLVYYNPKGVFEDYAYWQYGIWAFLLEVGPNYDTIGSELDDIIKKNVPGILAFLTAAPAIRSFQHNFSGQCPQGSSRVGRDLHLE